MDIYTTKPIEEIDKLRLKEIISNKKIIVSPHAYDHLSDAQRKIFKAEELIKLVSKENPRKIYLQRNGRYAVYYRKSDGYRKLILDIDKKEVIIVSFMDPYEIPKVKFENE